MVRQEGRPKRGGQHTLPFYGCPWGRLGTLEHRGLDPTVVWVRKLGRLCRRVWGRRLPWWAQQASWSVSPWWRRWFSFLADGTRSGQQACGGSRWCACAIGSLRSLPNFLPWHSPQGRLLGGRGRSSRVLRPGGCMMYSSWRRPVSGVPRGWYQRGLRHRCLRRRFGGRCWGGHLWTRWHGRRLVCLRLSCDCCAPPQRGGWFRRQKSWRWRRCWGRRSPLAAGRSLGRGCVRRMCEFIGRGLGRLETWERTASGSWSVTPVSNLVGRRLGRKRRQDVGWFWPRLVGNSEANGVGTSVVRSCGCKRHWDIGRFLLDTALVETSSQTASWPWSVGDAEANGVRMSVTAWVDRRRGVGWSALGRRSGWRALVKHCTGTSIGFCLAIAWIERRRDVGLAIGWRQRCGSIGSGIWWSETAWVSWLEPRQTASVENKFLAYE